jgi:hypothetical protein
MTKQAGKIIGGWHPGGQPTGQALSDVRKGILFGVSYSGLAILHLEMAFTAIPASRWYRNVRPSFVLRDL